MRQKIALAVAGLALAAPLAVWAGPDSSAVSPPAQISAPLSTEIVPNSRGLTTTTVAPAPVVPSAASFSAPANTPVPENTPPPAAPGPQPETPGTTIEVPQCVVTWTTTEQLPEPMPAPTVGPDAGVPGPSTMTVQDSYDGDCTSAQTVAADHPGSTVQQVTLPQTS